MDTFDDLVPVEGVIHLVTDLGIYVETQGGVFFVPPHCMASPDRKYVPGETVTLQLLRRFAMHVGLV